MVSSVQPLPFFRRRWPVPRPTTVSKPNHASVTPFSVATAPSGTNPVGLVAASVAASIALISSRPSKVLMVQVKATRSRQ